MSENDSVIDMATGEAVTDLCAVCGFKVTGIGCPNVTNHSATAELPPLGVNISDTSGVAGKVG
jgi:hypothetical protein